MAEKRRKVGKKRPKKRSKKRKDGSRYAVLTVVSLLAILVIAVALLYTKHKIKREVYPPEKTPKVASDKLPGKDAARNERRPREVIPREVKTIYRAHKVAIVIDDLGYDRVMAEELLKIDAALTFSIFPLGPHSKSLAKKAHVLGRDVMLHLPMEPYKYPEKNPGDGTLLLNMSNEELLRILDADIRAVPFIKGINNHMGSRFTEDKKKMRVVLKELKERDLFFIDSRTSKDSVGYSMAQDMGLKAARRNVFLDNDQDVELINAQISKLARISLKRGSAIGIGHPYPATIEALKQMIPELRAKGIEIVPVSQLID